MTTRPFNRDITSTVTMSTNFTFEEISDKTRDFFIRQWIELISYKYAIYNIDNHHQCHLEKNPRTIVRPFHVENFYGCTKCGKYHLCYSKSTDCDLIAVGDNDEMLCRFSGRILKGTLNYGIRNFKEGDELERDLKHNNYDTFVKQDINTRCISNKKFKSSSHNSFDDDLFSFHVRENNDGTKSSYLRKKNNFLNTYAYKNTTSDNDNQNNDKQTGQSNGGGGGEKREKDNFSPKSNKGKKRKKYNIDDIIYATPKKKNNKRRKQITNGYGDNGDEGAGDNNVQPYSNKKLHNNDVRDDDEYNGNDLFDYNDYNDDDDDNDNEYDNGKIYGDSYGYDSDYSVEFSSDDNKIETFDDYENGEEDNDTKAFSKGGIKHKIQSLYKKNENQDIRKSSNDNGGGDDNDGGYDNYYPHDEDENDYDTLSNYYDNGEDDDEEGCGGGGGSGLYDTMTTSSINSLFKEGFVNNDIKNYHLNMKYWTEYYAFLSVTTNNTKLSSSSTSHRLSQNVIINKDELTNKSFDFTVANKENIHKTLHVINDNDVEDDDNDDEMNENGEYTNIRKRIESPLSLSKLNESFKKSLTEDVHNQIDEELTRLLTMLVLLEDDMEYKPDNDIFIGDGKNRVINKKKRERKLTFLERTKKKKQIDDRVKELKKEYTPIVTRIIILIYNSPILLEWDKDKNVKHQKQVKSSSLAKESVSITNLSHLDETQQNIANSMDTVLCPKKICASLLLKYFLKTYHFTDSMGNCINIWVKDTWLTYVNNKGLIDNIFSQNYQPPQYYFMLTPQQHQYGDDLKEVVNKITKVIKYVLTHYENDPIWLKSFIFAQ